MNAMIIPLEITFHNLDSSPAVEDEVRRRAARLERFAADISACRVVVDAAHRSRHKGKVFNLRIHLTLHGGELSADRTMPAEHSHADIRVAIHDAFDAVLRQLENWKHRQRGEIKTHEGSLRGRIAATA